MSYPDYPNYKSSGVEWLGDIPTHWKVERLKSLFKLQKRTPKESDEIVTAFRDGEVTLRSNRRADGYTNAIAEHGYQRIHTDDLVIHAMDAFAGAIGVSDSTGKSTPVYSVCTPRNKDVETRYYGRLLRHMALSGYINALAKGVRERSTEFRWKESSSLRVAFPPIEEQQQIIDFLDRETGKLDGLIGEQRRLIALLREKRQAVISHAVTCGLPRPDGTRPPTKPSGIDWLGEVPEHWDLVRTKHICKINTGSKDTENAEPDGTFPFFVRSEAPQRINSYCFDGEAVLTSGDGAGVGKIFHHHIGKFECHQRVYMMTNFKSISGRFFFHYLRSQFYKVALEGGAKSTVDSIRRPMIANFPICIPPSHEMDDICSFIDSHHLAFTSMIDQAEHTITLLQERRRALISAAVTGKIDVRSLAPTD